jgi:hypothetical protein
MKLFCTEEEIQFQGKTFLYDFTESQAASFVHFLSQNRCFRFFEVSYWKDFQN